jgi:hypothetical protein
MTEEFPSQSHTSPLKNLLIEFHEIYRELCDVGFSDETSAKILANMLLEVVLYRGSDDGIEIELDSNDEEEDEKDSNDGDGTAGVG